MGLHTLSLSHAGTAQSRNLDYNGAKRGYNPEVCLVCGRSLCDAPKCLLLLARSPGASGFGGMERWNGMVEWTTGMEYWDAPPIKRLVSVTQKANATTFSPARSN